MNHDGNKFTKQDLIQENRKLMFEGVAKLKSGRRNYDLNVNILVLSDVVVFLKENNQKFLFITPEGQVFCANIY